jgi:hypothetical protein
MREPKYASHRLRLGVAPSRSARILTVLAVWIVVGVVGVLWWCHSRRFGGTPASNRVDYALVLAVQAGISSTTAFTRLQSCSSLSVRFSSA